jgi:hypothetical protein
MIRLLILSCWWCLYASSVSAAQPADAGIEVKPSADQGRLGKYQVTQPNGYNYWVCVPPTYSADHPAGIHLFFHGQGGQGGAENFEGWNDTFLKKYDLIGINMQYMDGDNMRDTAGKTAAARHAVAQIIADYKILIGKGVISSFSGGGLPHSLFSNQASKMRGRDWPFCHSALYSSNYRTDAAQGCPMSWFASVGTQEWTLATLGIDGYHRTSELFAQIPRGGCPDVHFKITKNKGHSVDPREVASSSDEFVRSDLAFAPFLYAPDYPEPELRALVGCCSELDLGHASTLIAKLTKSPLAPALASKVDAIRVLVEERLKQITELSERLAVDDPPLAAYYLPLFQSRCHGTPADKAITAALKTSSKDPQCSSTMQGYAAFIQAFPSLLPGDGSSPRPVAAKIPDLSAMVKAMKATCEAGIMAGEFLALSE